MLIEEDLDKISQWNSIHAIVILASVALCLLSENFVYLLIGAFASFCYFIISCRDTLRQLQPFGGYANWVTGFRFILISGLMMFLSSLSFVELGAGLIVFVSLDGVDGWLARKYKQSTTFGQYFDMELDALFVMMMCCYYFSFKEIGIWILFPGLLRYLYRIGIDIFPKKSFRESKKRYASTIAGIFFTILILVLFLGQELRLYLLAFGSLLIVVSFSISIVEYVKYDDLKNA